MSKYDIHYDPAIPLLGIYPKKYKLIYKRDTCIPMFIATKLWEKAEVTTTN
jgi:hypothetical protein